MSDDAASLVTIARFSRLHEAQLAKTRLEDAGIPCMLSPPDATGLTSMFDAEHSGIQLKVAAENAEDARATLDTSAGA